MRSSPPMRSRLRSRALACLVAATLLTGACASNQAYVEWRPGLSTIDFNGLYEFGFDEYREHREAGAPNLLFDRFHGISEADASRAMEDVGARVQGSSAVQAQTFALAGLSSGGRATFVDTAGHARELELDYFAATPDRRHAALASGSLLAVVIDRASIGIELGALLGPDLGGWQLTTIATSASEVTVFVLPELGGAVAPDEPGYVLEFGLGSGSGSKASRWQIGVGRIGVTP